jgi:DMSO/TMAO reductase YedYZ heme-binding membrane subunit
MTALISGVVVIVLVLGMTSQGHAIDASVQRFMLYYAGVFALIGLTASVGVGLMATDRIILTPGRRVMAQAVHRAVSFGALAFLIIHIVTEILAQRVHVIDGFVPFLSPFRTFYIGLGTIASDLLLLLVVTSIIRKRFTAHGKAWRWRAIHYTAYLSFVFGVLHGLLGGRTGKPYVDWSYGAAIVLTAFGVAVRFLAISLRPKETLSAPPAGGSNASPLHAATLTMAQAQLGGTIRSLPAAGMGAGGMALPAAPAMQLPAGSGYGYGAYGDGAFTPLGAPPYGDAMPTYPYQQPALASLPAPPAETRQPLYEPGYIGPPRYAGAPRADTGPMPRAATGPMPRVDSGPTPRLGSGPRPGTGPMPRTGTGPMPRAGTGPMPRMGTGPMPRVDSGPMPRLGTGPMPQARTGPMPQAQSEPMPQLPPRGGPPSGDQRRSRRPAADDWQQRDWQERDRQRRGGDGWR